MDATLRAELLVDAAPPAAAAALRDDPALCEQLLARCREALAAMPPAALDPASFASYVGRRLPTDAERALIERIAVDDLALACACVNGAPHAPARLRERHRGDIRRGLGRIADAATADELEQAVLRHLLVAQGDRPPRLADYAGRGPLGRWISVVARRIALDHHRHADADAATGDAGEGDDAGIAAAYGDPELAALRQGPRDAFRTALEAAAAALRPRERNMLRYAFVHQLGIDEIAGIYRVSSSTARRQLAAVRAELVTAVRTRMRELLQVDAEGLERELAGIESAMAITLSRILRAGR
ncbi:MAG: hypothetical protein IPH07_08830 [Deltaproteobacteria bacterium]|nr:hypothetical protein [Deltaproteobacteria bacterium]MBK8719046.1 hypothetical protein [Deltaproteobacteria bacterium]MBP7287963.1 hypothetical protein [Nannocystaceae bacterium]